MATGGKKPPDRGGGKSYKCHPDTRCNAVVCIICEDVYHPNDFVRKSGGVQISEVFVICKEHKELNLTSIISDHVLEPDAKLAIAQFKIVALNRETQINNSWEMKMSNLMKKIEEQKIIIEQLEQENITQTQSQKINENRHYRMDLDQTVHDEEVFNLADLECLKKENQFLKEMNVQLKDNNSELKEKNEMLKQILKDKESLRNVNTVSYAEAALGKMQKTKRPPRIVINKTDKNETMQNFTQTIRHNLIKNKAIQINNITEKKKTDQIIITCNDEQSVEKAMSYLQQKVHGNIAIEEKNKPKMKIVGINNFEGMNNTQLQEDINKRNLTNFKDQECKILHSYINKGKGTQTVLIETTADVHKYIRENNNKIYVGHEKCIAYDVIDVKPCYVCGQYSHKGKKCRNTERAKCIKCAGEHKASDCNSRGKRCINCIFSNNKYKTQHNVDHEATDYEKCEVFKNMVRKYVDSTDYSVRPVIPRDIGKVGNYINKPLSAHADLSVDALNSLNVRTTIQAKKNG